MDSGLIAMLAILAGFFVAAALISRRRGDGSGSAVYLSMQVASGDEPVLFVVRAASGEWRMWGTTPFQEADAWIFAFEECCRHDPTLAAVRTMRPGDAWARKDPGSPWMSSEVV